MGTTYNHVYAQTTEEKTSAEANALAYNQLQYKLHSTINASRMNANAVSNLQKFIDDERAVNHALALKYLGSTEQEQLNYKLNEANMSKVIAYNEISQRDWYITKTHLDNKDIFDMMKILKQQRINISDTKQ